MRCWLCKKEFTREQLRVVKLHRVPVDLCIDCLVESVRAWKERAVKAESELNWIRYPEGMGR